MSQCLKARTCKDRGDFLRIGQRYSRRRETQDERLARVKMVIAQQDLYGTRFDNDGINLDSFAMGPFYYHEPGVRHLEAQKTQLQRNKTETYDIIEHRVIENWVAPASDVF